MSCSACSNGLEKYLNKQTGVISASVNLVMANALIEYDESVLNRKKIEKFVKALDDAGYQDILNAKQEQLDAWVAQQK